MPRKVTQGISAAPYGTRYPYGGRAANVRTCMVSQTSAPKVIALLDRGGRRPQGTPRTPRELHG